MAPADPKRLIRTLSPSSSTGSLVSGSQRLLQLAVNHRPELLQCSLRSGDAVLLDGVNRSHGCLPWNRYR